MQIKLVPDFHHLNMMAMIKLDMTKLIDKKDQPTVRREIVLWYKSERDKLKEACSRFYVEVK